MKKYIPILVCILLLMVGMTAVAEDIYDESESKEITIYEIEYKNGFSLKKNDETVPDGIETVFAQNTRKIAEYKVSAMSQDRSEKKVQINLSALIYRETKGKTSGAIPKLTIETSIGTYSVDGEFLKNLADKWKNEEVYFNAEIFDEIQNASVKQLMVDAKREIKYSFTNSVGEELEIEKAVNIVLPYTSEMTTVKVYDVRGVMVVDVDAVYDGEKLSFQGKSKGDLLISEEKVMKIIGRTLNLRGTISMIFYGSFEGFDVSNVRMLFWDKPQSSYVAETAERIVECSGKDKNGYRFEYKNIVSKDMSKQVYARLMATDANGAVRYGSIPKEPYSVMAYAKNMRKNSALKPLLVKMLNYGTAAQEYFGSDSEPPNSILSEGERVTNNTKIYKSEASTITEKNGEKSSAVISGKTISLEGDISINYYTYFPKSVEESGVLFWDEYAFHKNSEHVLGTESRKVTDYETSGQYRIYSYENIVSKQMTSPVYARTYTKENGKYKYGDIEKYSVSDYVANQLQKTTDQKLIKLLRCLMLYGEEADKYFNNR